jgi:hypothetical protein
MHTGRAEKSKVRVIDILSTEAPAPQVIVASHAGYQIKSIVTGAS